MAKLVMSQNMNAFLQTVQQERSPKYDPVINTTR